MPGLKSSASASALVEALRSSDPAVSGPAWQNAAPLGAPAVAPLAPLLSDPNFETARHARRALYQIARHAGRPGASREASAVESALLAALTTNHGSVEARRHLLWILSEIAGNRSIPHFAALLENPDLREDARCALLRIPGRKSGSALRRALPSAAPEFQGALAQALRSRGTPIQSASPGSSPARAKTSVAPKTPK